MSNVFKKLKKLKGRSLEELRVRGSQKLTALAEKHKLTKKTLPTDVEFRSLFDETKINKGKLTTEGFLEHFSTRTFPKFFKSFHEAEKTKEALSSFEKNALIEKAESICNGRFDLLGFNSLFFGEPVDWHLDPISSKRSPLVHWSEISEIDADKTGDKKIIWELNRCQHFITLGRAFWHTGDERYAAKFSELIESWMESNPPKIGVNWMSSLELAFRSIAWLWAFYLFKDSKHFKPETFWRALKFLYFHAKHLEKFLSTYSSPNTHLTGEALGLFYLGLMLPEFKRAEKWKKLGSDILYKELDRHILPDGVYVERASYYQRYTTDFYLHLLLLSQENDLAIEEKLKTKLQLSLNHLMHITRPDGTTPFLGDDDGGRLLLLDERAANDFRATLATGANAFQRSDYKFVAEEKATEEMLWLFGANGLKQFENLKAETPKETSIAFPKGGYYVMRDSWEKDADYMLIDCGEHGFQNCGHAHADALSFELAAKGKTLLVDPGTYVYSADIKMRDWFRLSQAHNTLVIDNKSSSIPDGAFSWKQIADCNALNWITHNRFDFFAGEHDGYKPTIHRRNILFIKNDYWIVCDEITSSGEHDYNWNFHLAPNAEDNFVHFASDNVLESKETEQISFCYGSKQDTTTVKFQSKARSSSVFTFILASSAFSLNNFESNKIEIISEKNRDLFFVTGRKADDLVSDFKFSWMRCDADGEIEKLILINGKMFTYKGQNLVSYKEPVSFVYLQHLNGEFVIEKS